MEQLPPTPRQLEILALCAQGFTRQEIGSVLFISPWTVKRQLDEVRTRLEARSVFHAITLCVARGHLCIDGREEKVFVPQPLEVELATLVAA
jgi:DNA-binding CsgD family transcriptional regulator